MNAPQFILAFAPVLGISERELRTVDRAMADGGLREKAAGRNYPQVTRVEAIRLLLGYCASTNLTEAAEVAALLQGNVADLEKFNGQLPYPGGSNDEFCKASFGFSPNDAPNLTLVEAISRTCDWLVAPATKVDWYVGLEISTSGVPSFQASDWENGRKAEIFFVGTRNYTGNHGVETIRVVRPFALRWIGENTEVAA